MKYICLVSKDEEHFKLFNLNIITRIDVTKLKPDPNDKSKGICIFQEDGCTHTYEIVSFVFDHFASFINGNGVHHDIYTINVESIEE